MINASRTSSLCAGFTRATSFKGQSLIGPATLAPIDTVSHNQSQGLHGKLNLPGITKQFAPTKKRLKEHEQMYGTSSLLVSFIASFPTLQVGVVRIQRRSVRTLRRQSSSERELWAHESMGGYYIRISSKRENAILLLVC